MFFFYIEVTILVVLFDLFKCTIGFVDFYVFFAEIKISVFLFYLFLFSFSFCNKLV